MFIKCLGLIKKMIADLAIVIKGWGGIIIFFFNFVISWAILCHCFWGKFGLESED